MSEQLNQSNQSNQQIDISNMDEKQAIYVLWQLLTKAQAKGVYTIDESYAIKASFQKITDTLNKQNLDKEV